MREPLVTCICPTRNRREWLPHAIRYFQAQTYPNRELLILADGHDVRDLVPTDERIRFVETAPRMTIGLKRNMAVELARGGIVAHWDDDDFSAPERLAFQVKRLLTTGKAMTGFCSMYFTDGRRWWNFARTERFAFGTSLAYQREWLKAHPFKLIPSGEENGVRDAAHLEKKLDSVPAGDLMVASVHPGNTSTRTLNSEYRPVEAPEITGFTFGARAA